MGQVSRAASIFARCGQADSQPRRKCSSSNRRWGTITAALRTLLANVIDYAGLFPPAGLDMPSAVRNYADYLSGADSWALGRFIVPASRLGEFSSAFGTVKNGPTPQLWHLSVLARQDLRSELSVIQAFNERHGGAARIDALEIKGSLVEEIESAQEALTSEIDTYVEIPIDTDQHRLVTAIAAAGARAKARTGGVTADAFPRSEDIVRFMQTCVEAGVPFKLTAGLHHPIRSMQKLTYEPNAPTGMMYGFLNALLAAAFLHNGMKAEEALMVLEEQTPEAFRFDSVGVRWKGHLLIIDQLRDVRARVAISFGSCSFREPFDDMRSMNFLRSQ